MSSDYKDNSLVSIIIPVYNVAPFLDRCVKSIMHQSYENLEIVLVDDGSTDESGQICDELAKQDKRIAVIHQVNGGLSAARNTGIDSCHGDYVCFVDSDDYVHPDYVKYLYSICVDNGCDVGICGHIITEEFDYKSELNWNATVELFSRPELFDRFYTNLHGSIVVAWNKICKRECIGDIRYEVGMIHEDEATTFRFLYNAKKIALSREVLYYYYSRENSITGRGFTARNLDILKAYENRMGFYKSEGEAALFNRECAFYLSEILMLYYKVYYELDKNKELLDILMKKYRHCYRTSSRSSWGIMRNCLYSVCYVLPLLYGKIKKGF